MKIRPLASTDKRYDRKELLSFLWDGYYDSFFESGTAYDDHEKIAWRYVESGQIKSESGCNFVSGDAINNFLIDHGLTQSKGQHEQSKEPRINQEKPEQPTKERNKMLAVLLAVAMDKYGYDPEAKSNKSTGDGRDSIASSLEKIGLSVDSETVRSYLKESYLIHKDSMAK